MKHPLTLTVRSTHFYLIDCTGGKLLVDAGWELKAFQAQLKAARVPINEIRYVMFTHHHPDHAGLVQEIRNLSGAKLIIHQKQIPYLDALRVYMEKKGGYTPIRVEKNDLVSPTREQLHSIGVPAEIVLTPGHSEDSISLVSDDGAAYIGDLPSPEFADPETLETVIESWKKLLELGAQWFFHSHIDPFPAEQIRKMVEGM